MNCNWQNYQKLEQLPKNIVAPRSPNWLSQFFRLGKSSLANTLVRELSLFRQVEHLERCTKLDFTQASKRTQINEFTLTEPIGAAKRSLIEALYGKVNK
jgi:hypothetical protein